MDHNRRRFLRKVPNEPAFIQIERDEVGKVLNVSEGGLSFRSVTPVPRNLPVYFWFSFNLKDRIEAMGEVAWTDLSRTVGGLRFTQLSQGSREQIQKWLSRLRTEEAPREVPDEVPEEEKIPAEQEALAPQLVSAGAPARMEAKVPVPVPALVPTKTSEKKMGELDRVAKFVSKARAYRPILLFEGKTQDESKPEPPPALGIELTKTHVTRPMFSMETGVTPSADTPDSKSSSISLKGIESLVELVPVQRYLSAKKQQLLCGVILGICMSVAVTVPALKFWNSRAHADSRPMITDSSSLRASVPTPPPTTAPASASQAKPTYPVAGIFSDPAPITFKNKKGTAPNLIAKNQAADPFWDKPTRTAADKAPKASGATPAQTQSNSASASKKSGMTPNQLWTEVQAGNGKAALELAELYIKGDGVPRNCQQARVLLLVASEKRNTAAIKRLHDLDKGAACP